MNKVVYHPIKYFGLTFLITWVTWIIAAVLSQGSSASAMDENVMSLMAIGLFGPLFAAIILMIGKNKRELRRDIISKFTKVSRIRVRYLPIVILLMPVTIVIAIFCSLPLGQSIDQLALSPEFSIVEGSVVSSWIIAFLAPALEELGWSGYGIDSLRGNGKLLKSVLAFGVLWAIWHLPLFFIKGYYHASLLADSPVYAVNFFISVVSLTVITNWLYYRNNRSIVMAIVFHAIVNVCSEAFCVTNFTKCVVTVVITIFAVLIICLDKKFFFGKPDAEAA
ncbi:MAG: CPBP family intramembrane metalloprotease [Clostridiales Family XIII bacterium]|jgi:membrane protease YdiL (CAAX protease family)|nr:CPBP family intramembrane metalloprotease [Clostridiales Family XIII bacterium]